MFVLPLNKTGHLLQTKWLLKIEDSDIVYFNLVLNKQKLPSPNTERSLKLTRRPFILLYWCVLRKFALLQCVNRHMRNVLKPALTLSLLVASFVCVLSEVEGSRQWTSKAQWCDSCSVTGHW